VVEEPGALHEVPDPGLDDLGGELGVVGERLVEERGRVPLVTEGDLLEVEAHQGV